MAVASDATKAAYFLQGIRAGILTDADARDWARSVSEARADAPVEIGEVAASRGQKQVVKSLQRVRGSADVSLAGRWLLAVLKRQLKKDPSAMGFVARKACGVAISTNQPADVITTFDDLDDSINLAGETCLADLEEASAPYSGTMERET